MEDNGESQSFVPSKELHSNRFQRFRKTLSDVLGRKDAPTFMERWDNRLQESIPQEKIIEVVQNLDSRFHLPSHAKDTINQLKTYRVDEEVFTDLVRTYSLPPSDDWQARENEVVRIARTIGGVTQMTPSEVKIFIRDSQPDEVIDHEMIHALSWKPGKYENGFLADEGEYAKFDDVELNEGATEVLRIATKFPNLSIAELKEKVIDEAPNENYGKFATDLLFVLQNTFLPNGNPVSLEMLADAYFDRDQQGVQTTRGDLANKIIEGTPEGEHRDFAQRYFAKTLSQEPVPQEPQYVTA